MNLIKEKLILDKENEIKRSKEETKVLIDNLKKESQKTFLSAEKKVIDAALGESQKFLERKKREQELLLKQTIAKEKSLKVSEVYLAATNYFASLTGQELLDLVVLLIKKEKITNNAVMMVNKSDYQKYYSALYENGLNKLNTLLQNGSNISLSKDYADISSGFIIVGAEADISFEFHELVSEVRDKTIKRVLEVLFDE